MLPLLFVACSIDEKDCEERSIFDECMLEEPTVGKLNVKVTINANNPQVLVSIYKGKYYETGELVLSEYVTKTEVGYNLPFGDYAGTAIYYVGSDTLLAVYGDDISKELVEYCNEDCWEITEGDLDLTL